MAGLTALACVGQNDLLALRKVCNRQEERERKDFYGNTALLKACYLGRLEAALILLRSGADVKAANYCGQNALTLATYANNRELVYELLRWCTYKEFNQLTLTPPICVATMLGHWPLQKFYKELDRHNYEYIQTAHGLNCDDIMAFLKLEKMHY
ncbi:plutonium [Glossina fuscipes fuscipes]